LSDQRHHLLAELVREALGSSVVFAVGGSAFALSHGLGPWRYLAVAVAFGLGRFLAVPITRGPSLRVNPAASLLSRLRSEVTDVEMALSMAVQVLAMTLVARLLTELTEITSADLQETTTHPWWTAGIVLASSLIWFAYLTTAPSALHIGLGYGLVNLVGLPLGGGSLNTARTLAPLFLGRTSARAWAFAVPPLVAAIVIGSLTPSARGEPVRVSLT